MRKRKKNTSHHTSSRNTSGVGDNREAATAMAVAVGPTAAVTEQRDVSPSAGVDAGLALLVAWAIYVFVFHYLVCVCLWHCKTRHKDHAASPLVPLSSLRLQGWQAVASLVHSPTRSFTH